MKHVKLILTCLLILNSYSCSPQKRVSQNTEVEDPAPSQSITTPIPAKLDPFTHEYRINHSGLENSVKKIKFYLSEPIELKREIPSTAASVSQGVVNIEDGRYYTTLTIPQGTYGFASDSGSDYLNIKFGSGRSMKFSTGKYSRYYPSTRGEKIEYGDEAYTISSGKECYLEFPLSHSAQGKSTSETETSGASE